MSLKDDLEQDLDMFFNLDEFAMQVNYISRESATQKIVVAIWDYRDDRKEQTDTSYIFATLILRRGSLDSSPKYGDIVEFDSEEWLVIRLVSSDSYVDYVEIRRDARLLVKKT